MKKLSSVFLCVSIIFGVTGLANGTTIEDPWRGGGEDNLYEIFNTLFGTSYSTSNALFSARGLADVDDDRWYETNGGIQLTVRYAAYGQELGYEDSDGYTQLASGIASGYTDVSIGPFNTDSDFVWVEKWKKSGTEFGEWYSDDRNSSNDHFVAFAIKDQKLLNAYEVYGGDDLSVTDNVWLIAFEDLDLGDRDYNDLVAVITEAAPIPDGATVVLLGSAMLGVAVFCRKKVFKRS